MKKEQSKKESPAKKIFSQLVWVLSVALYFISEGFIQLGKRVAKSNGKVGKTAKNGKRRPNPVTAARRAENQEQETTAAAAVTAAKKAERPAHAAAAKAPAAHKSAAPAAHKPAAPAATHKPAAPVASAATHKPVAPVVPKPAAPAAAAAAHKPVAPAAAVATQKPVAPVAPKPAAPAAPVKKPEEQPQAVPSDAVKKPAAAATVAAAAAVSKPAAPTAAAVEPKPATPTPAAPVKQPEAQPAPAPAAQKPAASVIAPDAIAQLQEERAEKKPLKKLYVALICLLLIAVCVLLGIGVVRLTASVRANNIYKDLASNVQQSKDPVVKPTTAPTKPVDDSSNEPTAPLAAEPTEPVEETIPPETEPQMLPQYAPLYEKNPDLFGWVKVDDTKIDYPVMYAPDDLEKYLYHDFEGNSYSGGTPYMDVRCTSDSENYLIYGHNMKNGTMFKHLMKYQDEKFWKDHQTVYFDTLYTEGEYEVVAAFYDRVYYTYEDCFKFYDVIELEDEASYDEAIANFKEKSMYDTGVTPEYGTQLVTLITCAYHVDNGKFVVLLAEK